MRGDSFPLQVAGVLAAAALLLAYPLAVYATPDIRIAVAAGAVLSTVNVLLGYAAIQYAFHRSHTTFLKAVLGGMGLRMVLMLAALAGLIMLAGLPAVALTVSLMAFYAVFLVLELLFIQRKVTLKNER